MKLITYEGDIYNIEQIVKIIIVEKIMAITFSDSSELILDEKRASGFLDAINNYCRVIDYKLK